VDGGRIAAMGLSMGATHAYWLAALDDRVAAVVHLCAFADMGPLIASGGHDLHGIYMSVPGLLQNGDMGDVAALIAPRPQFIAWGGRDPLTPEAANPPRCPG
jgi:dienelactone hydrolase